ncbi:P-loop containing nucleoside triphosphate hydrolase protein [Blastocladiella britannica]|nr:P-loop containing nucleoside triphosphate hydrolase protein [Blastocladiella britannica]
MFLHTSRMRPTLAVSRLWTAGQPTNVAMTMLRVRTLASEPPLSPGYPPGPATSITAAGTGGRKRFVAASVVPMPLFDRASAQEQLSPPPPLPIRAVSIPPQPEVAESSTPLKSTEPSWRDEPAAVRYRTQAQVLVDAIAEPLAHLSVPAARRLWVMYEGDVFTDTADHPPTRLAAKLRAEGGAVFDIDAYSLLGWIASVLGRQDPAIASVMAELAFPGMAEPGMDPTVDPMLPWTIPATTSLITSILPIKEAARERMQYRLAESRRQEALARVAQVRSLVEDAVTHWAGSAPPNSVLVVRNAGVFGNGLAAMALWSIWDLAVTKSHSGVVIYGVTSHSSMDADVFLARMSEEAQGSDDGYWNGDEAGGGDVAPAKALLWHEDPSIATRIVIPDLERHELKQRPAPMDSVDFALQRCFGLVPGLVTACLPADITTSDQVAPVVTEVFAQLGGNATVVTRTSSNVMALSLLIAGSIKAHAASNVSGGKASLAAKVMAIVDSLYTGSLGYTVRAIQDATSIGSSTSTDVTASGAGDATTTAGASTAPAAAPLPLKIEGNASNRFNFVTPGELTTTLDDVIGHDKAKRALESLIVLPMRHKGQFSKGVLAQAASTGVLLYGPPGTGKTMLARAVAKSAGARFVAVTPSDLANKFAGESEKFVRDLFAVARLNTPCVIFLDEADSLFRKRDYDLNGYRRDVLNEFFLQWDGLKSSADVILLGTTNHVHSIDDAAIRRFSRRVLVDLPAPAEQRAILARLLRDEALEDPALLDEFLIPAVAQFSGSDLKNLCVAAATIAVREMGASQGTAERVLVRRHFEEALKEVRPSVFADADSVMRLREFARASEQVAPGVARFGFEAGLE